MCQKSFAQAGNLKTHIKMVHDGVKGVVHVLIMLASNRVINRVINRVNKEFIHRVYIQGS